MLELNMNLALGNFCVTTPVLYEKQQLVTMEITKETKLKDLEQFVKPYAKYQSSLFLVGNDSSHKISPNSQESDKR